MSIDYELVFGEQVEKRTGKRFDDLLTIFPYCNEATFYDNDNGFVTVAKYKNGEMRLIGDKQPLWLQELLAKMQQRIGRI